MCNTTLAEKLAEQYKWLAKHDAERKAAIETGDWWVPSDSDRTNILACIKETENMIACGFTYKHEYIAARIAYWESMGL